MTPKENGESEAERELDKLEAQRRLKEQIGDEKGVAGKEIVEEMEKGNMKWGLANKKVREELGFEFTPITKAMEGVKEAL